MPTDGADFGRIRACYGKSFIMVRDGADNADVAETIVRGVERDIRRDGGLPGFPAAVDILLAASQGHRTPQQILDDVEGLGQTFADRALTRDLASAVDSIALEMIRSGEDMSKAQAAEALIVRLAESRCCDGMTGYVARNRTQNVPAAQQLVDEVKGMLPQTLAVRDLASRMLDGNEKGMPARAPNVARLEHSHQGLSEEL